MYLGDKHYSPLNYQALIWRILGGVRRKAYTIPAFAKTNNGCVRIALTPLCAAADEWLGGLNSYFYSTQYTKVDLCEREFVFHISDADSGSYIIQQNNLSRNALVPVNCYGYSALKMAYAKWIYQGRLKVYRGEQSQAEFDRQFREWASLFMEHNGWSQHAGAAGMTVTFDGLDYVQVFVCTSGAESHEDRQCSLAGLVEAQGFFRLQAAGDGTTVQITPEIDETQEPLRQDWRKD